MTFGAFARSSDIVKLTDEQKEIISRWADEDEISMGEVQKRLKNELGIGVTYLETRFLLEDHGIELKQAAPPPEEEANADTDTDADDLKEVEAVLEGNDDDSDAWGGDQPLPGGNVTVTLDTVAQPQAMVSGKVIFGDGETAQWSVDQMGRLGLDPATPGYRPSEADIVAFQNELQRAMEAP